MENVELEKLDNENNAKVVDEKNFKEETLNLILNKLKELEILKNEDEFDKLHKIYMDIKYTIEDILKLQNSSREEIMKIIGLENKETKITLESIIEFQKKPRNFIMIQYPLPEEKVMVIENRSNKSAKEIFESMKDYSGLVSIDGFINSVDVYENKLQNDKIDIPMYKIDNSNEESKLELNDLTKEQFEQYCVVINSIIKELSKGNLELEKSLRDLTVEQLSKKLKAEFNKVIYFSPVENIVIISVPDNPSLNQIKTVVKDANGKYKLSSLDSTGYNYDNNGFEKDNQEISNYEVSMQSDNEIENEETKLENEEFGKPMIKKKPTSLWDHNKAS